RGQRIVREIGRESMSRLGRMHAVPEQILVLDRRDLGAQRAGGRDGEIAGPAWTGSVREAVGRGIGDDFGEQGISVEVVDLQTVALQRLQIAEHARVESQGELAAEALEGRTLEFGRETEVRNLVEEEVARAKPVKIVDGVDGVGLGLRDDL